jgi:hypothetical protein
MLTYVTYADSLLLVVLPRELALSATLAYTTMGLFYEFVHYLAHTQVQVSALIHPQYSPNTALIEP